MKKTILAIAALTAVFAGCKKDNTPAYREDDLIGQWVYQSVVLKETVGGKTTTEDVFVTLDDCQKDDITIFTSGKRVLIDEGALKCNPNSPQTTDEGPWAIENGNQLRMGTGAYSSLLNIQSLNASELQLFNKYSDTLPGKVSFIEQTLVLRKK